MRSKDVRDELQDGIETAAMPPMAPDGGLELTPAPPIDQPPPRLCEAGPCRHYHRMDVQLDAQNPMAERGASGELVRHARVFHTQASHYCYPDVGIETNLGSLPVLGCNRWVPITGLLRRVAPIRAAYDRSLAAWHDERAREAADVELAITGEPIDLVVVVHYNSGFASIPMTAEGSWSIDEIVNYACAGLGIAEPAHYVVTDAANEPLSNLAATVAELGLEPGVVLTVTPTKETV